MARTTDDLYDKLDELINVMTNRVVATEEQPLIGLGLDTYLIKNLMSFQKLPSGLKKLLGKLGQCTMK